MPGQVLLLHLAEYQLSDSKNHFFQKMVLEILLFPSPWPLTLFNLTLTIAEAMTVFVVSHNLQVNSDRVPALSAVALAEAIKGESTAFTLSEPLSHPHWLIRLESALEADVMAQELVKAWKGLRQTAGHESDHQPRVLGTAMVSNISTTEPRIFDPKST